MDRNFFMKNIFVFNLILSLFWNIIMHHLHSLIVFYCTHTHSERERDFVIWWSKLFIKLMITLSLLKVRLTCSLNSFPGKSLNLTGSNVTLSIKFSKISNIMSGLISTHSGIIFTYSGSTLLNILISCSPTFPTLTWKWRLCLTFLMVVTLSELLLVDCSLLMLMCCFTW